MLFYLFIFVFGGQTDTIAKLRGRFCSFFLWDKNCY